MSLGPSVTSAAAREFPIPKDEKPPNEAARAHDSDLNLILSFRAGNENAFDRLYTR